jgi:protein dithiol oxidoreductase (disulfide-forming)
MMAERSMSIASRLLAVLLLISTAFVQAQPREGVQYTRIKQQMPVSSSATEVEVIEVFSYACFACGSFEPLLQAWKARKPANVKFVRMPAVFNASWEPFARAYYAAEALGIAEKAHVPFFDLNFKQNKMPRTDEQIAAFYGGFGVTAATFLKTANSFAVKSKVARSKQLVPRYEVDGTPTIIVAGKYRVVADDKKIVQFADMMGIVDFLIQKELLERKASAPAVAPASK